MRSQGEKIMFNLSRAIPFKDVIVTGMKNMNLIGLEGSIIGVFDFMDVDFKVIPDLTQSPSIDPQTKTIGFKSKDEAHRTLPRWGVGIFEPLS